MVQLKVVVDENEERGLDCNVALLDLKELDLVV